MHRTAPSGRRRACAAGLVTSLAAAVLATTAPATASAVDPCTTPSLSEVMVSQGLPTYAKLAAGKSTLVKLFLHAPSCLPTGASISVTGARLFASSSTTPVHLLGALPLPPLGPPSTSPAPSSPSDVQFVVPGTSLNPSSDSVTFTAEVDYQLRTSSGTVGRTTTFATMPGGGAITVPVAPRVLPAGVLIVPMGDVDETVVPQFPGDARKAVQNGMTALNRLLPVADGTGLSYSFSPGMVDLGEHEEPITREILDFMPNGRYCGLRSHLLHITTELEAARVAWNAERTNPRAQRALGQVWQGISDGSTTGSTLSCAEGYAQLPGTVGWGRTIASNVDQKSVTGTLAAHEIGHTASVEHSTRTVADGTAPGRAYDVYTQKWLSGSRTAMQYQTTGWHDASSLFEKADWDRMQCSVQPLPPNPITGKQCPRQGEMTYAAAGGTEGSYVVTGATDGTPGGTDAYGYDSKNPVVDPEEDSDEYAVVQYRGGEELKRTNIRVSRTYDDDAGPAAAGTFGAAVPAASGADRIELQRKVGGMVVPLFTRSRTPAPRVVALAAGGQSLTLTVQDEDPEQLRLDLLLRCPDGTAPLVTADRPDDVVGGTAVFRTTYDTSLGCPLGTVGYRVTDGFSAASGDGVVPVLGKAVAAASIYAPTTASVTSFENLVVAGAARDADGTEATDLVWSLRGPTSVPNVRGSRATFLPPADGFVPGTHTLQLDAYRGGSLIASTTRELVVLSDRDRDRVEDDRDVRCDDTRSSAADDPTNALADSDGDGAPDGTDPEPCRSASTVDVDFGPNALFTGSSGVPVTLHLTGSQVPLTSLKAKDLFITQIAGHPVADLLGRADALPALSFNPASSTAATVKFDRDRLHAALRSRPGLLGRIPVFVGTLDGRLRGADPNAPTVFP